MVQVSKMLLGLSAMTAAAAVNADLYKSFEIPSFDYRQLAESTNPAELLRALQADGIVSLNNIPNYAQARKEYLDIAAACAVKAEGADVGFLQQKSIDDSTNRLTISTQAGNDLSAEEVAQIDAVCPGYAEAYTNFSKTVDRALSTLAMSLDTAGFKTKDGYSNEVSTRKLFTESVRLDHFHAYEVTEGAAERRLAENTHSLKMHEDRGLAIAFAAPEMYMVDSTTGAVSSFELPADDQSGLLIERRNQEVVYPMMKKDELVFMAGAGLNDWVKPNTPIQPVTHAMQMPNIATRDGERVLRAWHGQMNLLPSYHRMLSQMSFDEHRNLTTRYLKEGAETDLQAVGCAAGRVLVASDGVCTFKQCTPQAGATPPESCEIICNRTHAGDAENCAQFCSCTTYTGPATDCWMVCVKDFTPEECPGEQVCVDQHKECTVTIPPQNTTPTPPPTTTAPPATTTPTTPPTTAPASDPTPPPAVSTPAPPADPTLAPSSTTTDSPSVPPTTAPPATTTPTTAPASDPTPPPAVSTPAPPADPTPAPSSPTTDSPSVPSMTPPVDPTMTPPSVPITQPPVSTKPAC